jgi:hypothetical protein
MEKIVNYMKERYNNMPMFVTENGEVSQLYIFLRTKTICSVSEMLLILLLSWVRC